MKRPEWLLPLVLATGAGCASAPPPVSLNQSQALSENPNLVAARELAPQAFAHAEQIRIRALHAYSEDRTEEADALARQSLVAYERAATFARRVALEKQLTAAAETSETREREVARVAALQAQVAAETQALERSIELERSAEPRQAIEPEGGKRAVARAEAARSITEAARLVCVAARLIAPTQERSLAASTKVETLLATLASIPPHAALEQAMDVRVECLAALAAARKDSTSPTQEPDALLSKLSASMSDLRPHQDDRGIVLTDFGTWEGNQLSPHGADVVERIAAVAAVNAFPVLVVLHGARQAGTSGPQDAISQALNSKKLNASVAFVGTPLPSLVDLPAAKDRIRTEFVLITPK
jgi:hypothetical protein